MAEEILSDCSNNNSGTENIMDIFELPESVKKAVNVLATECGIDDYEIQYESISSPGENSYGEVLRMQVKNSLNKKHHRTLHYIVKLSPKNAARRQQMKVVDYYAREVFMYRSVINQYLKIQQEYKIPVSERFSAIPKMHFSSLADNDEFIVFEDLMELNYSRLCRKRALTFHHTAMALKELAKFHSMSFILKNKEPEEFQKIVAQLTDNLFNENIEPITIEFGKKYINRTIKMLKEQHLPNRRQLVRSIEQIRDNFKDICLDLVNGDNCEPHSVICHGDFWNNNILYRYDETGTPISAKLLDFQMSRYASPVLDIVHYLFTCTDKSLRDEYFEELMEIYYNSLESHLRLFGLDPVAIFPIDVFHDHLKNYGLYGFCIAIFAVPFFITDSSDIPDLDEISEALTGKSGSAEDESSSSDPESDKSDYLNAVLNEFEILTEKTLPKFKKQMTGIVLDLEKYNMLHF